MQQMLAQDRRLTLRLNWALARTRRTPSSAMIWVNGRSAPDLCRTSSQTSRIQKGWKLLETSFPCMTRIHYFWKTSSREETRATSSIRETKRQSLAWCSRLSRDQERVFCKNPKPKHCWSPSSTTKASSIRNLFLQVKPLMSQFTRQFWNDCYSVSGGFGQSCTGLENGCCSAIMPLHTVRSVCANSWLRRW